MKKYLLILLSFCSTAGFAQLAVQGSGLTIVSGTTININNLVLVPSTNLTLANQTITRSATPVPGLPTGASILQVHKFSTPITFSGTAAIKYLASELNGNTEALLQIAYNPLFTGGVFTTTTGSATGTAGSYYVSKSGLSGITIGQLTATNAATTLPIRLTSFDAQVAAGCSVKISWTAAATSAGTYTVEVSANSRDWNAVGTGVAASSTRSAYDVSDKNPLPGLSYYRLKITEASGAVSYSDVAAVRLNCAPDIAMSLSPNPARNMVLLRATSGSISNASVSISDAAGKIVKTAIFNGTTLSLDISSLPAGTYFVTCKNEVLSLSWKLVHQ